MEKEKSEKTVAMRIVSAMEKVLPSSGASSEEYHGVTLKNGKHCFQLALNGLQNCPLRNNKIEVTGEFAKYVKLQIVDNVPASLTAPFSDDYVLGGSGIYPDVIRPFKTGDLILPACNWKAVWVEVKGDPVLPVGVHTIGFVLTDEAEKVMAEAEYELEVLDAETKKAPLRNTNWMHYDCIANAHGVELFTDGFYKVFDSYLKEYVGSGLNMLLTPLFTPPLDTYVGGERKTAQLIGVEVKDGKYAFDFAKLDEFLDFVLERGIEYIEFSHLFTQWGGEHCPKIVATVDGEEKKIFGWEDDSCGAEYAEFLGEFLTKLVAFIKEKGIAGKCCFHLTDEPNEKHVERYSKCRELVKKYIGDLPTMDALSHYEFYEKGLVDIAVPVTFAMKEFTEKGAKDILTYYCCAPTNDYYSNRMLNMPMQRTRVIGFQMYESGVKGFLHWGFNFYNSGLSYYPIDPYANTDADGSFPAGDGFIVYPSADGVNPSLRAEAMRMAFDDVDALYTLESFIGREKVVELLHKERVKGYNEYPRDFRWHLRFREKIDRMIAEYSKK